VKVEILLKMAKLAYRTDMTGFAKASKGKLPYIDGVVVYDSMPAPYYDALSGWTGSVK
jgi:hypothetical protein